MITCSQYKTTTVTESFLGKRLGSRWWEWDEMRVWEPKAAAETRALWKRALEQGKAVKLLFPCLGRIKAALEHCEIHSIMDYWANLGFSQFLTATIPCLGSVRITTLFLKCEMSEEKWRERSIYFCSYFFPRIRSGSGADVQFVTMWKRCLTWIRRFG